MKPRLSKIYNGFDKGYVINNGILEAKLLYGKRP
jgi:hypothetical protein